MAGSNFRKVPRPKQKEKDQFVNTLEWGGAWVDFYKIEGFFCKNARLMGIWRDFDSCQIKSDPSDLDRPAQVARGSGGGAGKVRRRWRPTGRLTGET
jgi:hypothetical protein